MEAKLTKSLEDYLEALYIMEQTEEKIHSVRIANFLHVSKPAVNKAMNELLERNYIQKEPYGDISLTKSGRAKGKEVFHRHTTIKEFLMRLGVSEETSEHDCCLIEHVLSKETFAQIEKYLKN